MGLWVAMCLGASALLWIWVLESGDWARSVSSWARSKLYGFVVTGDHPGTLSLKPKSRAPLGNPNPWPGFGRG